MSVATKCFFVLVLILALCTAHAGVDLREQLKTLQKQTRTMDAYAGNLERRQIDRFYSTSLELNSDALLKASCLYEEAAQLLLDKKPADAFLKITTLLTDLSEHNEKMNAYFRRAISTREILRREPPSKASGEKHIVEVADIITKSPGTFSDNSIPRYQFQVEEWYLATRTLLDAFDKLINIPRNTNLQLEIVKDSALKILQYRNLLLFMTKESENSVMFHETLLDKLVFEKRGKNVLPALQECIIGRISELPNSLKPGALALLSVWYSITPLPDQTPVLWRKGVLSKEEIAEYFRCLDEILKQCEYLNLYTERKKMGSSFPEDILPMCPSEDVGTHIADILIEASRHQEAFVLLDRIESDTNKGTVTALRIKNLLRKGSPDAAVALAVSVNDTLRETDPEIFYWQAESNLKLAQYAQAAKNYAEFVKRSPSSRLAPAAALMAGIALLNTGKMNDARPHFLVVAENYPNSPEAEKARSFLAGSN